MLGGALQRSSFDRLGLLLRRTVGFVCINYDTSKRLPSYQISRGALGAQPAVLFSQLNLDNINLDNPILKKYVTDLIQQNKNDRDKKNLSFLSELSSLLQQREQLLQNINSLNELKQDDKDLKALAEEEQSVYQNELITLDNEILKTIVPRNAHENYSDVMVEISSGAGGQEAMLFANELLQMYENYASLRNWTFFIDSLDKSDVWGGIKSASILISGPFAYYYMQNEIGVHRVQRVPVTSASGAIHTSTAAVIVMPQPTEVDVNVSEKDIIVEFCRASGPGGQNVNKSESAVRIKHIPTGLIVECQEGKTQHGNKKLALTKLRTKLFDIEIQKQNKEINSTRRSQLGNRERSAKIRTYNFPQNRVTDHRAQVTTHNIKEFMQGQEAFHNFLEKLNEQNEKQIVLQFLEDIIQSSNNR